MPDPVRKLSFVWNITSGAMRSPTLRPWFKRGETVTLLLQLIENAGPCVLPDGWSLVMTAKQAGHFDGAALLRVTDWSTTETAGTYTATATVNSTPLDAALAVNEDGSDDIACVPAFLDFAWLKDDVRIAESAGAAVHFFNNVGRAEDTTPLAEDLPDDWLTARAVRFDVTQTLDDTAKARARTNIGAMSDDDSTLTIDSTPVSGGNLGFVLVVKTGNVLGQTPVANTNTANAIVQRDADGNFVTGAIYANGTIASTGYGVYGNCSEGYGVQGNTETGYGVAGSATMGYGLYSQTTSGVGLYILSEVGKLISANAGTEGGTEVFSVDNAGTVNAVAFVGSLAGATGLPLTTGVTGILPEANGGTGNGSYANGQLLIGTSSNGGLTKATLTGTTNQVNVTNGNGSITLSLPQSIGTASSPQFSTLELGHASDTTISRVSAGVIAVEGATIATQTFVSSGYQPLNARLTAVGALANASGLLKNDGAGVFSYASISGSGNVAGTTSPSFTTPTLGVASATSLAFTSGRGLQNQAGVLSMGLLDNSALTPIEASSFNARDVTGDAPGTHYKKTGITNYDATHSFNVNFPASITNNTVTFPNITGTIVTTGDTGTVTNTMLAGSIADSKLSTISTAGKVSDSALSSNVPLLDTANSFSNATNTFVGGIFSSSWKSTTALATPSALSATQFTGFASTVSGATLMGYGTTGDVTLKNRAGTDALTVGPNTTIINLPGTTSSSSSTTGTLTAGNGTAATNVGIGGGNIYAGGYLNVGDLRIGQYNNRTIDTNSGGQIDFRNVITMSNALYLSSKLVFANTTVAGLPSASGNARATYIVTDATAPTTGSAVVGGGSTDCLVRSNGSAWIVIG